MLCHRFNKKNIRILIQVYARPHNQLAGTKKTVRKKEKKKHSFGLVSMKDTKFE